MNLLKVGSLGDSVLQVTLFLPLIQSESRYAQL